MLAPQPGRTFPKPVKIISKKTLFRSWNTSRDSTERAGRPGIDNVSALQFASKLDSNFAAVVRQLRHGQYGFSRLRPVFIPKPNSDKERMICIPIVRDRLIQRVIVQYLSSKKCFPIYNSSSFGFIEGQGTRKAIEAARELRSKYTWCLKTDIEAFFDRIPRNYLKKKVLSCLGQHSLTPLIYNVIDCEIKITEFNRSQFLRQKISAGRGVRQGMPLSPMLSNLALADFDRQISEEKIPMVRYADDLVLFFESKQSAQAGQETVRAILKEIQLNIPDIYDGSKTKILSVSDPLDFLGREIVFLGNQNGFVSRISSGQTAKIKARLSEDFALKSRIAENENFQDTVVSLSRSIASYLGIYSDAFNYASFEDELRGHGRNILRAIFEDLFGSKALSSLGAEKIKFLGIGMFDEIKPNQEIEV